MSLRHCAHALDFPELRVLNREFDREKSVDILRLAPIKKGPGIKNGRYDIPSST